MINQTQIQAGDYTSKKTGVFINCAASDNLSPESGDYSYFKTGVFIGAPFYGNGQLIDITSISNITSITF